jgi:hypothetical protein
MHRYLSFCLVLWLTAQFLGIVRAEEYTMLNGDALRGSIASATEDGLIVSLDVGGYSQRVPWAKFTQDALKRLVKDSRAKAFVEPFIEIPLDLKIKKRAAKPKPKPIALNPGPRVTRPDEKNGLFAAVTSPMGLALLAVFYLANLAAAYEIAVYRRRPAALVCGVSALLPGVGPLVFISLPLHSEAAATTEGTLEAEAEQDNLTPTGAEIAGGSLSIAKTAKPAGGGALQPAVYSRGETTFNRRFFETKFAGFFRIVPGDAEKNMVIIIRCAREEHITKRISRITANEMHLILLKSGAEVTVAFPEITQVELRRQED